MASPQIDFRPFVEVSGVYDTGLSGVAVNSQGQLGNATGEGVELTAGISGVHSWKHTKLGLDYRGSVRRYTHATSYDSTDQSLMLGIAQQLSRHVSLTLNESAGLFSRNFGLPGLSQTVPFDPSTTYAPTTDFFDNRAEYLSTQANVIFQKTARLSFSMGGDGFLVRQSSSSLYGATGATAHADVQYRLTRRTTLGANYSFTHFDFVRVLSSTDMHNVSGVFSVRLSRWLEFSAEGGMARAETKFIQNVPIDPAIAALIGTPSVADVSQRGRLHFRRAGHYAREWSVSDLRHDHRNGGIRLHGAPAMELQHLRGIPARRVDWECPRLLRRQQRGIVREPPNRAYRPRRGVLQRPSIHER
jgi:hypothetical protein